MLKIVLLACVVYFVQAQHGHSGLHTHHNEHGTFQFFYEETSGELVALTATHCYIMKLSDDEKKVVHTTAEFEKLELKLIGLSLDQSKIGMLDITTLSHKIQNHCQSKSSTVMVHE